MIDMEKVIKAVEEAFDLVHSDFIGTDDFNETEWEQNKANALAMLKEQEAVVRCCDCEHWDSQCHSCEHFDGIMQPDFYCADGVKRDD